MFRVTDADATPDTVDVSLHDTPDGDDLASAQLGSAGAEEDKSRSGNADGGEAEADSVALALAASAFITEIGAELEAAAKQAQSSEPSAIGGGEGAAVPPEAALAAEGAAEPGAKGVGKSIHGKTDSSIGVRRNRERDANELRARSHDIGSVSHRARERILIIYMFPKHADLGLPEMEAA